MNIENLIIVAITMTIAIIMLASALNPFLGGRKISIVRTLYGGALALLFGAIGGTLGNLIGDPEKCLLIGMAIGFLSGYTLLINRIIVWAWKKFWALTTWWVKAIMMVLTIIVILWAFAAL